MTPRRKLALAFLGTAGLVSAVLIAAALLIELPGGGPYVSFAILMVLAGVGALWLAVFLWLLAPAERLAGEVQLAAETGAGGKPDPKGYPALTALAEAARGLADRYAGARREVNETVAAATRRADEQRGRLEALLRDLTEGVIVCNLDHQVLLYNQMVVRILGAGDDFGLGRSLFGFVTREPVQHTLEWLQQPADRSRAPERGSVAFVCATADARLLLQGRMSLIVDSGDHVSGYVLTFADATRELAGLGRRDALLRAAIGGLRAPVANLRAAAETMAAHPEMAEDQRRAFEQIVVKESTQLSDQLQMLSREQRGLVGGYAAMADLHSADLINCVIRRLKENAGITVTMTGLPHWLHGDSYALMLTLSFLIERIRAQTGIGAFDLEARPREGGVYLDVIWAGEPLPSAQIGAWLEVAPPGSLGGVSVRDVLERHHSDAWSEAHRPGFARLRLPVPGAFRPEAAREAVPARPEFYDFGLLSRPQAAVLGPRPLRSLTYVVFDTETTGLNPNQDEIVSIAGVRIVNGRILTGETFSRLVHPGRAIPPESTAIHGITDAMVQDKPPAAVVLPQFRGFVGDAVLVAHNIAFDLSFLAAKEEACGVRFEGAVLDTMLLSATLYEHASDHTLDALAIRYGIEVHGRHSALGDSMMTAAVFLAQLDALEGRGINTLDDAMRASRVMAEIRAKRAGRAATTAAAG